MSEIYCTGVVIANGIPDSDGDVLDKKQIKQIFTKYTHETDTMHTYIKNEGVDVIENWITETPTKIGGKSVPAGSWLATTKISNPEIINSIQEGRLNAYSLGSVPKEAYTEKYWFINKSMNYSDVSDIENIQPLFISFVDKGANGYIFEVYTYDAYINKNEKNEDSTMSEEAKIENKEEMVSLSALEKIRDIFGISKAETETKEEDAEPPADEPADDEKDITNKELLDSISEEVTKGVVNGLTEFANQNKKEAEEEKPKEEEAPTIDKSETKEEKPVETVEDVKINKRETKKEEEVVSTPNTETSFYKRTGRDEFGCKIKK